LGDHCFLISRDRRGWTAGGRRFQGRGRLRIEPDRLIVIRDGAVEVAFGAVRDGAIDEGRGILRIDPNGHIVICNGTVVVAFGAVRHAAIGEGPGKFGIEPNRLTVISDGTVVVAFGVVCHAAAVEGHGVVQIQQPVGRLPFVSKSPSKCARDGFCRIFSVEHEGLDCAKLFRWRVLPRPGGPLEQ
jgi:hypothetical protein